MRLILNAKNINLSSSLKDFIEKKIRGLKKFIDRIKKDSKFFEKGKPPVKINVGVERTTRHHLKGEVFRAEGQIELPGKSLRAEAESDNLRSAVIVIKKELQEQLKEYKNKMIARNTRGQRKLKRHMRFSFLARLAKRRRVKEEGE